MWDKRMWGISLIVWCCCLAAVSPAQAHKLLVSAVVEADGGLKVQVFFPDGAPAQEVPVKVTPGQGGSPMIGKTDVQGVWKLAQVAPGSYRVEAGDPLGHRAETRVVVAGAAAAAGSSAPSPGASQPPPVAPGAQKPDAAPLGEPIPWGHILAGLGFIFGVSAFIMVLKLRGEVKRRAPRD